MYFSQNVNKSDVDKNLFKIRGIFSLMRKCVKVFSLTFLSV